MSKHKQTNGMPGPSEPSAADPNKVDPSVADPRESDPRESDPNKVDPSAAEKADPSAAEKADPSAADKDRYLRLAADFDNYRRRVERDRVEQVARAQASLLHKLLDVMDDLERVVQNGDKAEVNRPLLEGVQLVEKKFRQVMEGAGVEAIAPGGQPFNPEVMEALMMIPTEDEAEDDIVADVYQKGYRYNGVLLRPARVTVRKHGA